jgi:hypothetical protein
MKEVTETALAATSSYVVTAYPVTMPIPLRMAGILPGWLSSLWAERGWMRKGNYA